MMENQQPLFPHVGVLALTYHSWNSPWMTPHHVLTRLARYFHVVWANPAHEKHEIWKKRGLSPTSPINGLFSTGFHVYTPESWLPNLYRPSWLANLTFDQRLKRARLLLEGSGCQKIILYLWFPEFIRALTSIPFDLSCYHIDDEYSFSSENKPLLDKEEQLIKAVDQVFVVSPGLMEKKGIMNPYTDFVSEGVDYLAYAGPVPEPVDLASIPHPRIGYTGHLKKQINWLLLLSLAQQHPEWSFVLVGPRSPHPEIYAVLEKLSKRSNVHFLGAKSTQELTAYPQHFDVCIMPYHVNDYTKYIYPLKLHEYLASGRPVVGSPIRSLQEFGHVLTLAQTVEEWSCALKESLPPFSPAQVGARRAVAREHDWSKIVWRVADILCTKLGPTYRARLEEISIQDRGEVILK